MKDSLISQICNPQNVDRDLLIDELNDEIEVEAYSQEETLSIIHKLLRLLPTEQSKSEDEDE